MSLARAVWREVAPDLLNEFGIDNPSIRLVWFLLRIENEFDARALGCERTRIEDVQAFVDGVGLGNVLFQLEGMDRRDLRVAAERTHAREARFESLDRRN